MSALLVGSTLVRTLAVSASLNPVTAAGFGLLMIAGGIATSISKSKVQNVDISSNGLKATFYPPES